MENMPFHKCYSRDHMNRMANLTKAEQGAYCLIYMRMFYQPRFDYDVEELRKWTWMKRREFQPLVDKLLADGVFEETRPGRVRDKDYWEQSQSYAQSQEKRRASAKKGASNRWKKNGTAEHDRALKNKDSVFSASAQKRGKSGGKVGLDSRKSDLFSNDINEKSEHALQNQNQSVKKQKTDDVDEGQIAISMVDEFDRIGEEMFGGLWNTERRLMSRSTDIVKARAFVKAGFTVEDVIALSASFLATAAKNPRGRPPSSISYIKPGLDDAEILAESLATTRKNAVGSHGDTPLDVALGWIAGRRRWDPQLGPRPDQAGCTIPVADLARLVSRPSPHMLDERVAAVQARCQSAGVAR